MHETALADTGTPDRVCPSSAEVRVSRAPSWLVRTGTPQRLAGARALLRGAASSAERGVRGGPVRAGAAAHLAYRSDAEFDWGGSTEGALELAFAMLADATQSRPTDLVGRAFCAEVVTGLNPAGFLLSHGDVALWLLTDFGDASSGEPRA